MLHPGAVSLDRCALDGAHTLCRWPLLSFDDFELDVLAFVEALEALHLDRGMMDEDVLRSVLRRDESEAFRVVKPLYCTTSHRYFSFCHMGRLEGKVTLDIYPHFVETGNRQQAGNIRGCVNGQDFRCGAYSDIIGIRPPDVKSPPARPGVVRREGGAGGPPASGVLPPSDSSRTRPYAPGSLVGAALLSETFSTS